MTPLRRTSLSPIALPTNPSLDLHPSPSSPSLSISTSRSTSTTASSLSLSDDFDTSGEPDWIRIKREGSMSDDAEEGQKLSTRISRAFILPPFPPASLPPPSSDPSTPGQGVDSNPLDDSPSGSVASTAKDGLTPRAELSQPIWPLSTIASDFNRPKSRLSEEPKELSSVSTGGSLKRDGSWRKKHASLDTPPDILPSTAFASFSDLRSAPPLVEDRLSEMRTGGQVPNKYPPKSPQHPPGSQILAASTTTGCCISAPMSPPAHYPIPMSASSSSSSNPRLPSSPKSTAASSTSSTSSAGKSPNPPRWAQPPTRHNRISARANSFSDAARPDVDFDPELFEAEGDDEIEVIKGTEGRIAVKATKAVYEIMVWLPGFTLDNITIATRGARTIHIVADQWEEGDHAQWDIKLGDDANMRSIGAKFGGHDLKITVAREQRRKTSRGRRETDGMMKSTSTPATPAAADATLPTEPADYWASQWSPHPMTRRVQQKSSLKTI